jgi:hypothetical protein
VLVNCPGPPQFMPSFSLCVTDAGLTRVEIGEVINTDGHMRMADIHLDPPGYPVTDPASVLSVVDPNALTGDSKACWGCHESIAAANGQPAISKPQPYLIFGKECVIGTDEPGECPDAGNCNNSEMVTAQTLEDVCGCISQGVNEDAHPLDSDEGRIADALCEELMDYQATRGICGSSECPQEAGPTCSELDADCDPYEDGAIHSVATGYTCQEVSEGVLQCVSSRSCVEYSLSGGGKFLGEDGVSFVRLEVNGKAAVDGDGPICDSTEVSAELSAFDHATNTQIDGADLSSFTATDLGGGDFSAEGEGSGDIDLFPANIHFEASKSSGTVAFDVEDSDSPGTLAGGTGEAGRADFGLTEAPAP